MSNSDCGGYRREQGQYVLSSCSEESSTFFIILGFTMLVLVLLLFVVVIIACVKRHRLRVRTQQLLRSSPPSAPGVEDDCEIVVDGSGQNGGSQNGRNLDNVKCVIMAGEEKPTFIAHPVRRRVSPTDGDGDDDGEELHEMVDPDEEAAKRLEEQQQQQT